MGQIPPASGEPPQYASYPRTPGVPVEKLRSLAHGYFGLNTAFLINILIAIPVNIMGRSVGENAAMAGPFLIGIAVLCIVVATVTYGPNKKIAEGMGWNPSAAIVASVLMALNSILCCGIVGYIVMQLIAGAEMKKHGVKIGFFAQKKKVLAEIDALASHSSFQV